MAGIKSYHSDDLKVNSLYALIEGVLAVRLIGSGGYTSDLKVRWFIVGDGTLHITPGTIRDTYTVPGGTTIQRIEVYNIVDNENSPLDLVFTAPDNTLIVETAIVTINDLEVRR